MSDSKMKSISEVLTNMAVSLPIHYFANFIILPPYAADITAAAGDFGLQVVVYGHLAVWFSIVSFIRQYLFRRLFDHFGKDETALSLIKRGIRRLL